MGNYSVGEVKIPKEAKKVFEGILYDTYHWEQELFDGSFKTFEKVFRLPAAKAFVVIEDKIIMLKEEQPHREPFNSLPGGMVERNETPKETIKKELLEELGMVAENIELWNIFGRSGSVCWNTYYFIAKGCKKISEPKLEAGEKNEPYKVSFEELLKEVQKDDYIDKILAYQFSRMSPEKLDEFKRKLFE